MNSKFLTAGLIAAMMIPAAASAATSPGELRRDRQDIRQEKRDVRQAVRYGDRRDVREEHRELRGARQEYREDARNWRRDRRYANWHAPFRYRSFAVGTRLGARYYAPAYRLNYDARWRLPHAGAGLTYVRHYNDLLLVNLRSGAVVRVHRGFF